MPHRSEGQDLLQRQNSSQLRALRNGRICACMVRVAFRGPSLSTADLQDILKVCHVLYRRNKRLLGCGPSCRRGPTGAAGALSRHQLCTRRYAAVRLAGSCSSPLGRLALQRGVFLWHQAGKRAEVMYLPSVDLQERLDPLQNLLITSIERAYFPVWPLVTDTSSRAPCCAGLRFSRS